MRVLLAGVGLIGQRHMQHLHDHPHLDLVGVIDPAPVDADVVRFDDIADVDIAADAIIIATPSHLHADHAEQSAVRGWHMLIEKPLAHDRDAAARIIAATKTAGVHVLVGQHRRYHAAVTTLRDVILQGRIGTPVAASLIWSVRKPDDYFVGNWRQGQGGSPVMINLVHEVDTLRFMFGEITHVAGFGSAGQRNAARVESGAVALGFASGMTAAISFADTAPSPWSFEAATGENPNIAASGQDNLRVMGTKGALSFPSMRIWDGADTWADAQNVMTDGYTPNTPLDAQLDHFADVISGKAAPVIDAEDAARTLDITLQIETCLANFAGCT